MRNPELDGAHKAEPRERFWSLAEGLLNRPGVTRSTMMGLPCLRVAGRYFASLDTRTGCLVIKLPRGDVQMLVASGEGQPFAPAGRVFREWVAILPENHAGWGAHLERAHEFVSNQEGQRIESG